MRVIIISWEYPPRIIGNIAHHVEKVARTLADSGFNTFVVTFHDDLRGLERQDGIGVFRVGNPVDPHLNILTWDLTLAVEIERKISDIYYSTHGNIDLIDAHEWLSIVPSIALKKAFAIPFIYSIHSLEEHRSHFANAPLNHAIQNIERLGTRESCRILVQSDWMKSEVQKLHSIPEEKIVSLIPSLNSWAAEIKDLYQSSC